MTKLVTGIEAIQSGKPFRHVSKEFKSVWIDHCGTGLGSLSPADLMKREFEIKQEPREFWLEINESGTPIVADNEEFTPQPGENQSDQSQGGCGMNREQRIDIAEIEKQLTPIGYNDERDVFEMGEWAGQYGRLLIDYIRKMDAQLDKLNQVAEAAKRVEDALKWNGREWVMTSKFDLFALRNRLEELERE